MLPVGFAAAVVPVEIGDTSPVSNTINMSFTGEITEASAQAFVRAFKEIESGRRGPITTVVIMVNSGGGDLNASMLMRESLLRTPLITIADIFYAASAAAFLFGCHCSAVGIQKKGRFLSHAAQTNLSGEMSTVKSYWDFYSELEVDVFADFNRVRAKNKNVPLDTYDTQHEFGAGSDSLLNAQRALDAGFVQYIGSMYIAPPRVSIQTTMFVTDVSRHELTPEALANPALTTATMIAAGSAVFASIGGGPMMQLGASVASSGSGVAASAAVPAASVTTIEDISGGVEMGVRGAQLKINEGGLVLDDDSDDAAVSIHVESVLSAHAARCSRACTESLRALLE